MERGGGGWGGTEGDDPLSAIIANEETGKL